MVQILRRGYIEFITGVVNDTAYLFCLTIPLKTARDHGEKTALTPRGIKLETAVGMTALSLTLGCQCHRKGVL